MSFEAVSWVLHKAPMLTTGKGRPDTSARFTLTALAEVARGNSPRAWPALATLEFMTGFNRESLRRALGRLSTRGLIEDTGERRGGCVVWRLRTDVVRPESDRDAIEDKAARRREAETDRKRRARSATQGSGQSATQDTGQAEVSATQGSGQPPCPQRKAAPSATQSRPEPVSEPVRDEPVSAPSALDAHADDAEDDTALFDVAPSPPAETRPGKTPTADTGTDFPEFWATYPRKDKKHDARTAYTRAVTGYRKGKEKFPPVDPAVILAAAKRYAGSRQGEEPKFTSLPTSWLNGRRWEDESTDPQAGHAAAMTEQQARAWLNEQWEHGRALVVAQRIGIDCPEFNPPPDIGVDQLQGWRKQQGRKWIESVGDRVIHHLTTSAPMAVGA